MKGMDKAVKRILKAIEAEEKILIFADYDTDGVPGAVVLTSFFDQIGHKKYHVHIPDRKTEAYGLTPESVEKIATEKASLIITIDCGITSVEGVKTAKKLGMDVVITDHHLPQEKIPACVAVVDNKQSGDQYDFKMLCGCAVAFQLARALATKIDRPLKPGWDKWLLDLVAISTVADMVPMVGENRTLTYFGLKVLRQTKRPGLIEMMKTSRLNRENINEDDIGFVLAPRLNTASRMSHANHSYYLLTTSDPAESKDIAKYLEDQIS